MDFRDWNYEEDCPCERCTAVKIYLGSNEPKKGKKMNEPLDNTPEIETNFEDVLAARPSDPVSNEDMVAANDEIKFVTVHPDDSVEIVKYTQDEDHTSEPNVIVGGYTAEGYVAN